MVSELQAGEIDIGIGLTEGWVNGMCKAQAAKIDPGFMFVGTYVQSSLQWGISVGAKRDDINSQEDLIEGSKTVGVSRLGSGSYVMSQILANQLKFNEHNPQQKPPSFTPVELQTFARLREAVNDGTADFFLWEYFTSKRYYDNKEIKHVGDVYAPWPSWTIVANNNLLYPNGRHMDAEPLTDELRDVLEKIKMGVEYFKANPEEAVQYISTKLDYSEEDAREWLKGVRFDSAIAGVERENVARTAWELGNAGAIENNPGVGIVSDMIALDRGSKEYPEAVY